MKREIKFRLWAKDPCSSVSKEEMVYLPVWTVFDGRDLVFRTDLDTFWIDSSADGGAVVMQFTGLRDKNGVEIYEGDVNRNGDTLVYSAVHARFGWTDGGYLLSIDSDNDEVIGNIYEHPELLGSAGMRGGK